MQQITNPHAVFLGPDGRALDGAAIFVGRPNSDPEFRPVQVYWDAEGKERADQPLRTSGGVIVRGGKAARVYGPDAYSMRVRNAEGRLVFEEANVAGLGSDTISVRDFGAVGDGTTDDTAAFQTAVDAAHAAGLGSVLVPNGEHAIHGTVYLPKGVTLYGHNPTGEYYPNEPGLAYGATLVKPNVAAAKAGPVVELRSSTGLLNLAVRNEKASGATTGAVRFGPMDPKSIVVYAAVINCHVSAIRTGDLSGAKTSRGIFFPGSQSGYARYFNRVANVTVTECDIGIGLQQQCNANNFSNVTTRECQRHYELNGSGSLCIENIFTGLALFSINKIGAVGFCLQENVQKNVFFGYTTEMYGTAYDIDDNGTTYGNYFLGKENEAVPSYIPAGNVDFSYEQGTNNQGIRVMTLPTRTTGDRNIFMPGAKWERFARVEGALPQLGGSAGQVGAGDPNSRIIARFGAGYFRKAQKPSFRCRLRLYADGYAAAGMDFAEVEFVYRTTDSTAGAGQLCVTRSVNKSSHVVGLYFITSVSSPAKGFALALVGGNAGAQGFDSVTVAMEVEALTFSSHVQIVSDFYDVSFSTEAVGRNDVRDAISLLAIADTAV